VSNSNQREGGEIDLGKTLCSVDGHKSRLRSRGGEGAVRTWGFLLTRTLKGMNGRGARMS